jgi:hypothetical protein
LEVTIRVHCLKLCIGIGVSALYIRCGVFLK